LAAKKLNHDNGNKKHIGKRSTVQNLRQKSPNNWVNLTAGSSVCANRVEVQWPPQVTLGVGRQYKKALQ